MPGSRLSLHRLKLLGYRVLEADNGAPHLLCSGGGDKIDLIFSDVIMPGGMTGYELAATRRSVTQPSRSCLRRVTTQRPHRRKT